MRSDVLAPGLDLELGAGGIGTLIVLGMGATRVCPRVGQSGGTNGVGTWTGNDRGMSNFTFFSAIVLVGDVLHSVQCNSFLASYGGLDRPLGKADGTGSEGVIRLSALLKFITGSARDLEWASCHAIVPVRAHHAAQQREQGNEQQCA